MDIAGFLVSKNTQKC